MGWDEREKRSRADDGGKEKQIFRGSFDDERVKRVNTKSWWVIQQWFHHHHLCHASIVHSSLCSLKTSKDTDLPPSSQPPTNSKLWSEVTTLFFTTPTQGAEKQKNRERRGRSYLTSPPPLIHFPPVALVSGLFSYFWDRRNPVCFSSGLISLNLCLHLFLRATARQVCCYTRWKILVSLFIIYCCKETVKGILLLEMDSQGLFPVLCWITWLHLALVVISD